jgi:hypothetical protein
MTKEIIKQMTKLSAEEMDKIFAKSSSGSKQ